MWQNRLTFFFIPFSKFKFTFHICVGKAKRNVFFEFCLQKYNSKRKLAVLVKQKNSCLKINK